MPELASHIEQDQDYLNSALRIKSLTKAFRNLDKETAKETPTVKAVDELSLSIFRDQIFVLLGHNGAGKTTTINMLTNMGVSPDEGSARAFGLDVFKQRGLVNDLIGICPQHDVLVTNMSVMDNLIYFCGIKMMTPE